MSRRQAIIATDMETGEERFYECLRAAEQALGASKTIIWNVCNGKQRSSHGYTFRYAPEIRTISEMEAEIILALAECDLKPANAAKKMYVSVNTVYYHLQIIKNLTGKDPRKFYDMCELLPIAKAVLEEE